MSAWNRSPMKTSHLLRSHVATFSVESRTDFYSCNIPGTNRLISVLSCLFSLQPTLCPLCRKPFLPDRAKKLITGDTEGIEEEKALDLLKKRVEALDTEASQLIVLEVERWLASNMHPTLRKAHDVLKEFVVLKLERSVNLRSIRRLEREVHRLRVDQSYEKENASVVEQNLKSQVTELQSKAKLEERRRSASATILRRNPLPVPPEPLPLETLPFFANIQQNTSRSQHVPDPWPSEDIPNILHLDGVPTDQSAEILAPPPHASPDRASLPLSSAPTLDETIDRNTIIPGASPNHRFVPRSVFEEEPVIMSYSTNGLPIFAATPPSVDPFMLATEYVTEYAQGYEEAYRLSQRPPQSSSRRPRHERTNTEPLVLSPISIATPPIASRAVDEIRLSQQPPNTLRGSAISRSSRRPLRLEDFYPASASGNRDDSTTTPTQLERTSSSLSATIVPLVPPEPSEMTLMTSSTVQPPPTSSSALPSTWDGSNAVRSSLPSSPSASAAVLTTSASIPDDASYQSSHISHSSQLPRNHRRWGDVTNISSTSIPTEEVAALPAPNDLRRRSLINAMLSASSAQQSPLRLVEQSPMSVTSYDSWGTVSTLNRGPRGQPFRLAHDIVNVRDLDLRGFDDLTNDSLSRRSSMLSDMGPVFDLQSPPLHFPGQGGGNNGDFVGSNSDSQNRTPRIAPRSLPELDSPALFPTPSSRASDRQWDASSIPDASYGDQHHGTTSPSMPSEDRYRMDAFYGQSSSDGRSQTQSHSSSDSDRSSRTSRHHFSHSSTTASDNPASPQWEGPAPTSGAVNALGLTDISTSPEPRISAPTPVTPSRSFLRSYSNGSYR
ncbi:hypothetical protein H0H87_006718 [Tephrocybe sp. NHM501043]|nr:hypothetical protein H0H87_006718 [Tephrocybe sp. NHM501043]